MSDRYISYRQLFMQAMTIRNRQPNEAVRLLRQASAAAKEQGDPHEGLFIDHWLLQTLLHVIEDYDQALDLAVQTAVEARKPLYKSQMERMCVHEDLIGAYMGIDPLGHEKRIEDAMAYMENEVTPSQECYYCLLGMRSSFEMIIGPTEKCEAAVRRFYSDTQSYDRHHHGSAHLDICWLLAQQGEWERLLPYTLKGIEVIGDSEQLESSVAALWAVQALALRNLGREAEADLAFQRAKAKAERIVTPMGRQFYDWMSAYHQMGGQVQAAISVRERQLREMTGKGQPYWEAVVRLSYARLLRQVGAPYTSQVDEIRRLAETLKKPEVVLEPLAIFEAEA